MNWHTRYLCARLEQFDPNAFKLRELIADLDRLMVAATSSYYRRPKSPEKMERRREKARVRAREWYRSHVVAR